MDALQKCSWANGTFTRKVGNLQGPKEGVNVGKGSGVGISHHIIDSSRINLHSRKSPSNDHVADHLILLGHFKGLLFR